MPSRQETKLNYGWDGRPNWICRLNCGTQTHTRGMMNVWLGKSRRVFTPIRRNDKRHHGALTPEIGAVWIHLSLGATGFIIIFTAGYALGSAYGESWCSSSSRIISAITPPLPRANICIQPTGVRTIISIYGAAASVLCVKVAILGCAAIWIMNSRPVSVITF